MSADTHKSNCWVISDGAAGNERQALALARALKLEPRVIRLQLGHPWDWFAPHLTFGARSGIRDEHGAPITQPWPDIAIGCGRKAALLTRCLRSWSNGGCFTVQILDPRTRNDLFDVVIAPKHDRLSGDNVIETLGSLNPIDDNWLDQGRRRFSQLGGLSSPRTGVLIGATTTTVSLDDEFFSSLLTMLGELHALNGGSFLVSTSRRTPPDRINRLRSEFQRWPGMFWGGSVNGENPYAGILAWSDRIIVSPDSVNMISEACATGKPVAPFASKPLVGKLALFHQALRVGGYLADAKPAVPAQVLRETASVAAQVRQRLLSRNRIHPPGSRG